MRASEEFSREIERVLLHRAKVDFGGDFGNASKTCGAVLKRRRDGMASSPHGRGARWAAARRRAAAFIQVVGRAPLDPRSWGRRAASPFVRMLSRSRKAFRALEDEPDLVMLQSLPWMRGQLLISTIGAVTLTVALPVTVISVDCIVMLVWFMTIWLIEPPGPTLSVMLDVSMINCVSGDPCGPTLIVTLLSAFRVKLPLPGPVPWGEPGSRR